MEPPCESILKRDFLTGGCFFYRLRKPAKLYKKKAASWSRKQMDLDISSKRSVLSLGFFMAMDSTAPW